MGAYHEYMRQLTHLAILLLSATIPVLGQPYIYSVQNGSGPSSGVVAISISGSISGPTLAQGSIISIDGQYLGPDTLLQAPGLPLTTALPNNSTGTSVQITSGSTVFNASLLYASAYQVGAIMPSNVPLGAASVTVTVGGQVSGSLPVRIVATNFVIFTKNKLGYAPGLFQNYVSPSSTPLNALTTSAQPGQVVILYGTGLGAALDGKDNVAPKTGNIGSNVGVTVGGFAVTPTYAGRSSQYPGLDQINFPIPFFRAGDFAQPVPQLDGCYIPVVVSTGAILSNTATVSISQTNVCNHPLGVSAAALGTLDAGGSIKIGTLQLARGNPGPLDQTD